MYSTEHKSCRRVVTSAHFVSAAMLYISVVVQLRIATQPARLSMYGFVVAESICSKSEVSVKAAAPDSIAVERKQYCAAWKYSGGSSMETTTIW